MSQDDAKLRLLDDLPVGVEGDSFQHGLYADMLAAVFRSGKPGRCVGFFGKWGQGKSSVVKQLEEKLAGQTTVITFNAWKSSGDSIRRQLLLHVIKMIDPSKYTELKKFVGVDVLRKLLLSEEEEKKLAKEERGAATRKTLSDLWLWARMSPLLAISLSLLLLGLALVWTSIGTNSQVLLSIALGVLFPAGLSLALYVRKCVHLRYLGHLTIGEAVSESQRIRYPEQFEELFIEHVSKYCHSHGDVVVVIDDLDRCDAHTVAEALAAIRQFTPDAVRRAGEEGRHFRCQFLVPCDEQQVILALATAGHDPGSRGARVHDYESKELLRKFFDVTLRMHEMYQDDFLGYAGDLAKDIDLDPQEAREIVALVGPRDPRLVKQLLNALCLSHDRLERQRQSGALPSPDELPDSEHTERLLVALRETVPRMYSRIVADSSILEDRDSLAWRRIAADPPLSDDADSARLNETTEAATKEEVDRTRRILAAAGRVSAATAEILIHGKLPKLLHGVVGGGNLARSLRPPYDQQGFCEALSNLDPTERSNVQQWLTQEARRISKQTATGLRQIMSLFLQYPKNTLDEDFILPCIEGALEAGVFRQEALTDHPHLDSLLPLFPRIDSRIASWIHVSLVEGFLAAEGESDSELQFLLTTCRTMPMTSHGRFRTWLVEGIKAEKGAEEFVSRISRLLPEDRSLCYGFAPEGAVAAAGKAEWEHTDVEAKHPRQDVIMTLLGDSPEHAAECLDRILDRGGPLATVRPISSANAGFESAWVTVGQLLSLATDSAVQTAFTRILPWLRLPLQQGSRRVLEAVGKNVLRLDDNQFGQLAQFITGSLAQRPQEIWLVKLVGEAPDSAGLAESWKKLAGVVFNRYADYLVDVSNLNAHVKAILVEVQGLQWPVSGRAERLLSRKLQAPSGLQQFQLWLDALAPLVRAGGKHDTIRMKILEVVEKKRESVDKALAAGLAIPWAKEIDVESATSVGRLFIGQQSSLIRYEDFWHSLREKKGAGRVLDTMADALPEETATLKSFGNALNMIAKDFDLLNAKHKRSFLDKTLLSLISTLETTARQMGIDLCVRVPRTTAALRRQLTLLIKEGSLSPEQEEAISEVVEKPLLRARRKAAS